MAGEGVWPAGLDAREEVRGEPSREPRGVARGHRIRPSDEWDGAGREDGSVAP